jgi:hypothetical protein
MVGGDQTIRSAHRDRTHRDSKAALKIPIRFRTRREPSRAKEDLGYTPLQPCNQCALQAPATAAGTAPRQA